MIELPIFWLMDRIKYRLFPKSELTWSSVMIDQLFDAWLHAKGEQIQRWANKVIEREDRRRFA